MNTRFIILLLVVAVAGWASCKNNDNVFPKTATVGLNIINASNDTLNLFINGTRQTNFSLTSGGQSFYLPVAAGLQNYQFKKNGGVDILFSVPLNLKADSINNSLYITDETTASSFSKFDFLDTTGINTTPKAKIRFVNASSDAGSLNVTVGSKVSFSSIAFKQIGAFTIIDTGLMAMKVKVAGSDIVKVDTSMTLAAGHMYTLFSKGSLTGKGTAKLSVALARNF
ncbi:DUF4397 domain-containing protein [Mucilaginibacter xinganensis]|uniref:DUF4397 domain-containing protein n=1 Tax=Mucilaginibacter xinganensis TaxID=1234841 RepID=A0A223NTV3_9SPHI|nr:DUF4397 domain-containing protein [Mucilaginibacter xinganensis]ASU33256.1 hypothetical protein MuYL_1358 [Mucilaginibacter xinganensis]